MFRGEPVAVKIPKKRWDLVRVAEVEVKMFNEILDNSYVLKPIIILPENVLVFGSLSYKLKTYKLAELAVVAVDKLLDYLSCNSKQLNISQAFHMLSDISKGAKHIHERGIVHRDLHARNILVFSNFNFKVSYCCLTKITFA